MTQAPGPVADTADLRGPYAESSNGHCVNGHPLNGFGRCEPLNLGQEPHPGTTPTITAGKPTSAADGFLLPPYLGMVQVV